MISETIAKRLRSDIKVYCLSLLLAGAIASSASAQNLGDNLPSGSFIMSRPITNSTAEGSRVAEAPDYVVLGGKDEVLAALGDEIMPLSDSEQATIFADTVPEQGLIAGKMDLGLDRLTDSRAPSNAALAQEQSGGVGGIVRGAVGIIPSAMGTLRGVLGTDK